MEIYNARTQPLNYVKFKAILLDRFSITNPQISDLHFRSAKQFSSESLPNFATRLKTFAVDATIPEANINQQILSVIRSTKYHHETRMKCLEDTTTLETLLAWRKQCDIKIQFVALMDSTERSENVLQVNSSATMTRLCYTCGYDFPHKGNTECPAKGKTCSKCGRIGHFSSVC